MIIPDTDWRPRVWIDGQCFQSASRYRGIGRAILETITWLRRNHDHLDLHLSLNAAHPEEAQTARHILGPLLGRDRIHVWEGLVERPESQGGYTDAQRASEAVLAHHIRSLAPDLVWSPSIFEGGHRRFVSLLDPKSIGVPSLVTFHDAIPWRFPDRYLGDPVSRACYVRHLEALGQYDIAMAVSRFAEAEMRDIHPDVPVVTVSSGLSRGFQSMTETDLPRAGRGRSDTFDILYVGGIDWRKNVPAIIEALGLLRQDGRTDITLTLIGDQPEGDLAILRDQARAHGVEDWLRFNGFCSDMDLIRAYQLCDVAVQPSIMEGFGLTALEAMQAGAPLIAARAGALPEVVGDAAYLFDPYHPGELAGHLARLMDDPALGDALRKRGRERCKQFDWEITARRVAKTMTGLVRPTPNQPDDTEVQRGRTLKHLGHIDGQVIPPSRLAAHLTAAEIQPPAPGRLFIDVTSTLYANHGTGIQRVVTKVAQKALEQFPDAQLVICDSDSGLETATLDRNGSLRTTKRLSRDRVYPRAGDTLLLLDSSWTWHRSFETVMRDARLRGATVISVLYDLVPVAFPAFCDDGMPIVFQKWLRAALRYSDGFMCISKATADHLHDLLQSIDFPRPMKIGHWPLGADISARLDADENPHDPDHFLCVATLEPRKGHGDLIAAFRTLWQRGESVRLTLIGRPGWGTTALQQELSDLAKIEPLFEWISDADDARLSRAYRDAGTVISTSYAEGFGLPLVEGRLQGCGVIARDIEVFREIAPEGTAFFSTQAQLVEAIQEARKTPPLSKTLPSLASWEDSARHLVERVLRGDFPQSYRPREHDIFRPDTDTGDERMRGAVDPETVGAGLRVLPNVLDSPLPDHVRYAVEVTNGHEHVLYSRGRLTGEDCVHLSYMTQDHDGHERDILANRTKIPFALGRGQSTILPIDVPADIVGNPNIKVHFALVQEGRDWWPVLAELPRDPS